MPAQEYDEPYRTAQGGYEFDGDGFDDYISDVAVTHIEASVESFDPDNYDSMSFRDYVFDHLSEELDAEHLFTYNHPAAWGQAIFYADHASVYADWESIVGAADSPRMALKTLAFICVEADVRHAISTKIDQYESEV